MPDETPPEETEEEETPAPPKKGKGIRLLRELHEKVDRIGKDVSNVKKSLAREVDDLFDLGD